MSVAKLPKSDILSLRFKLTDTYDSNKNTGETGVMSDGMMVLVVQSLSHVQLFARLLCPSLSP